MRHLPSGVSVRCTQERSQLMNRAIALEMLRAKLLVVKMEQKVATKDSPPLFLFLLSFRRGKTSTRGRVEKDRVCCHFLLGLKDPQKLKPNALASLMQPLQRLIFFPFHRHLFHLFLFLFRLTLSLSLLSLSSLSLSLSVSVSRQQP